MARADAERLASAGVYHGRASALCLHFAGSAERAGRSSICGKTSGERCATGSLGICHGDAVSHRVRALASIPVPEFPASAKSEGQENSVEWAWAMNAGSSVLGSVLAMVIAIQYGLNATLACGAGAYLTAILLAETLHSRSA